MASERPGGPLDELGVERQARMSAEEQLADLKARVDNAQQLANMGDYDWHIASDTNRWSDQLYRIYGYEPQSFNASYERFLSLVLPDDREHVQDVHRRAYETGEPYEMIERIRRPDGSIRFLSSNGQVVQNESGQPVRMRGTCVDITDRVLAEQAREKMTARFRDLVESCPDAILVLDARDVVVQANRGAHDLLDGDPTGVAAALLSLAGAATARGVRARTLSGRVVELDVTVAGLHSGGDRAVYLRDAAVRHQDESRAAELRETQIRHRQALEINDDVIQGLTAAVLAMQLDDRRTATTYLEQTLTAARELMNDWVPDHVSLGIQPGKLVRRLPSALPKQTHRVDGSDDPGGDVASPPPLRIVVVDDNDDVRTLLCAQLSLIGNGVVVGEAANGREAVELVSTLQPDLVLLDLSMPDMDGLQALPRIRDAVPDAKVIVMSGFDQRTMGPQVLACGASRFVEKGLRMNLRELIQELFVE